MTWNQRRNGLKRWSECYEKTSALADTSTRFFRPVTSSFLEIFVCVLVSCDHLSRSMLLPFLSQYYNHVVTPIRLISEEKDVKIMPTYVVKITIVTPWCSVNATLTWYSMKIELNHQDKKRGLDPISMRMSQWYSEPICEGNDPKPIAFTRMNEDSSGPKKVTIPNPKTCCER